MYDNGDELYDVLDILMGDENDFSFLLGDHTGANDQQGRKSNQGFRFAQTTPSGFF